jgi:uncharacterized membrane protein (UPF0127 family)
MTGPQHTRGRLGSGVVRRRHAILVRLSILLLVGLSAVARADDVPPLQARTTVTIRGQRISAEVARTAAEQERGLGYRDGLAPGTGMVFPYTEARRWSFWMKGMRFDLDIIWIRADEIVDISRFVPAPRADAPPSVMNALPTFSPREPADTVLEVVAGTANARGWQIGDRVAFEPPLR